MDQRETLTPHPLLGRNSIDFGISVSLFLVIGVFSMSGAAAPHSELQ
jgi:hypothetical protein